MMDGIVELWEKSNYGTNMKFGTFPGNYVKILPD